MKMKKLINDPYDVTDELVEGFASANRDSIQKLEGLNVVVRKDVPRQGKVGIVIGGGSGHEPLFLGFVGKGMGDACAHGAIFTSPSPDLVLAATKAADNGSGVLYIYGNYAGDILNFDMAADMAAMEGIEVATVRVWDDIASAPREKIDERRGTAADVFVIKAAGARSEMGGSFDQVVLAAKKARDNCVSLGVALSSCTLPAVGKEIFSLDDDDMMIGMGLHGEAGVKKTKLLTADETADAIIDRLLPDLPIVGGDQVCVLVNGYGSTTRMELLIVTRRVHQLLEARGVQVYDTELGNYCTSQEMAGCSVTLMKLDDELKELWDYPADSPGFKKFGREA